MCMCMFYGVAHRGATGGLKEGEGEAKRVRVSLCESLCSGEGPGPALGEREEAGGRVWDQAER